MSLLWLLLRVVRVVEVFVNGSYDVVVLDETFSLFRKEFALDVLPDEVGDIADFDGVKNDAGAAASTL